MSIMKNTFYPVLLMMVMFLSGCELVGDIFQAGVWAGVLIVVAIIGLVIYLVSKLSGKK
jgi:cytosine/uracil/thiamine/allantoin permease